MKKLFAMLLVAVMSFSLIACGGKKETSNQEQQKSESSLQQTAEEENNENAILFVGVWTDGNTILIINEDGSCNKFIKEGYVKGEPQTDISRDYVWKVDDSGNLLTIDEVEGGYDVWVRVEENERITLQRNGATEVLFLATELSTKDNELQQEEKLVLF